MTEKILKEISKRFSNGTETIEDIINYCRNYEIKFENGLELRVVEKKYFDKLVKKIKELEEENRKLKVVRSEYAYGYENTYFITKNDLVQIDKNKYLIEIEEGRFVDLKQVYLDNKNGIPTQKIKDIINKLNNEYKKIDDSIDIYSNSDDRGKVECLQIISWIEGELEELLQESEE